MPVNEVPVSTNDSMIAVAPVASSRGRMIRLATCCVVSLLVGFATPWSAGASPSLASPSGSSSVYAAAPGDNDDDGDPDEEDFDDDNDGTWDIVDEDPLVPRQTPAEIPDIIAPDQDSDNDGIVNIMDRDDDIDMVEDDEDAAPFVPAPPVDTPAPPAETPETPAAEVPVADDPGADEPGSNQPDQPAVQQSAPPPPARTQRDEPAPYTVQSQPQDTAPLVVALPSTGGYSEAPASFPWTVLLAALSLVLGTTGVVIRRNTVAPAKV